VPRPLTVAILALVAALFLLPLVRPFPLLDPDEGLHAAITQEMIARGDYVMPRFLGEPFLDKPILFFWSQALSMRCFGQTEAAARLPGLAFGALGAITTGWLAATVLRNRRAWVAALLYTTMLVPMALMQSPVHDIALVPFTNVALLAFWRAAHVGTPSSFSVATSEAQRLSPANETGSRSSQVLWWSLLAGVALGVSMLTKGMSGVAIVGLAHGTVLILERRVRLSIVAGGILALLIAAAVAAPWYVAMERMQPGYLHYYVVERHLFGFATETQRHGGRPFWYYIPVLLGGALPWSIYVPFSLRRGWIQGSRTNGTADATRVGWAWLITGWIFLSLAGSKLFTYAMPLFPAIALLATIAWLDRVAATSQQMRRFDRIIWIQAGVSALLLPAALIVISTRYPISHDVWLGVGSLAVALGWWSAARAWSRAKAVEAAVRAAMTTAATVALLIVFVMPAVADRMTARGLSRYLNGIGSFPSELWIVRQRLGSVVFYLEPALRQQVTAARLRQVQPRELRQFTAPRGTLVAVADEDVSRVARVVPLSGVPYDWLGRYRVYTAEQLGIRAMR
jgi:4-amino-4-deoxy-L-arabinose transferase